jgi:antitoxin (DNA-binding transcriptional repressor) of toxin-antitoxin stability system
MPNIKPVSDLRNYAEVLNDIRPGSPVFLTENGRGCYVVVDMREYEKTQAALKLMSELEKGRVSGEKEGWSTLEEAKKEFDPA